jgi:hypothetical protein
MSADAFGPVSQESLSSHRNVHGSSVAAPVAFPADDDILVSQPFIYQYVWNAWSCYSGIDFMIAEDCYPTTDYSVTDVDVWMIFSSGTPVTQYNLGIQCDSAGPDGSFIWRSAETNISSIPTGYSGWGFEFWHSHIAIACPPTLPAGGKYWFCLQAESASPVYWLFRSNQPGWGDVAYISEDDGASWFPSADVGWGFGTFLVIQGTTSLGRQTWGAIKSLF